MVVGVPREIKDHETRVGLVPSGVAVLREAGHEVLVEARAGEGSSIPDEDYRKAGAVVLDAAKDVWGQSDIVIKVKEPQLAEVEYFRPGLILFTYLHLAPLPDLTEQLVKAQVSAIAYETVEEDDHSLPLLEPMSEVAGRLSVQVGAQYLERPNHGRGVLIGGVPGVPPAEVLIIGGGIVGTNAAKVAMGTGARVTVIDKSLPRLRELDDIFLGRITTLASNQATLAEAAIRSDLVVGAVLIPGASAPKLLRRETVAAMKKGSVFVDVAIDQGGCGETSRVTSHTDPVFELEGVIHYGVPNIPALVPHTSTLALTNATLPYLEKLANRGFDRAIAESSALRRGVNTHQGEITCHAVADSQGREWKELRVA
jgi:alanine dehydrogenase